MTRFVREKFKTEKAAKKEAMRLKRRFKGLEVKQEGKLLMTRLKADQKKRPTGLGLFR